MKVAILADIHANFTALEAVLEDVDKRGGTGEIWCLGDTVGYGPDPHQCLDVIHQRSAVCVAGNHDWAAVGKIDTTSFNPEAAEAAQWTHGQLHEDEIQFLADLPLKIEKADFTLVHGSPRDPIRDYLLSVAEAKENSEYFQTPYCLIGHSHLPLIFNCGEIRQLNKIQNNAVIKLGSDRLIINPGGVGQPRDGDPRAAYAIYDDIAGTIAFQRVKYDIPAVQQRMQEAGLPHWLSGRLASGR
jgi:diadenosine tetraphosphatase ApaH/serine/threonine PP2A family protein phosphatase